VRDGYVQLEPTPFVPDVDQATPPRRDATSVTTVPTFCTATSSRRTSKEQLESRTRREDIIVFARHAATQLTPI